MSDVTITLNSQGHPDKLAPELAEGEKVTWVAQSGEWFVKFKKNILVDHWPFQGEKAVIRVTTTPVKYIADERFWRKSHHYETGAIQANGEIGPFSNGARIIVR